MEETIFTGTQRTTAREIGELLVHAGEKLKAHGSFTLNRADESIEVRPEGDVTLEISYETKADGTHELEIELEWKPDRHGRMSVS